MFQGTSMGLVDSLLVSVMGLTTVFICLAALCIAIKVFSMIFSLTERKKPATAPAAPIATGDEEDLAVLMCAASEETGLPLEKFRITKIDRLP